MIDPAKNSRSVKNRLRNAFGFSVVLFAIVLAGGCATYHRLPLADKPDLSASPAAATSPQAGTDAVPLALDLESVGRLARARDPDLAASRAQVKVARAQAYDAGLLPDPTLGFSLDHPFNGGAASDHHNAWTASLTESLVGLITHGDVHSAARAHYAATLLSWRWQAEQVTLKARVTYLDAWAAEREVKALQQETRAARRVLTAARKAHAAGALAAALYQQALQQAGTVRSRLQSAADREVQARTALATMLRVQSGRRWHLAAPASVSAPAPATVSAALDQLPTRRLDLLALQAGYRSADARLRADILAQFPLLDIGFTRARDNTGVNSVGFGITLRLPIFNGNRGKIAIDRATRAALNAAYQAHLDRAANTARAGYERLRLVRRELVDLKTRLPDLRQAAQASGKALARGDITRFQAFGARSAWLDARIDADRLRANAAQLAFTLQTLLVLPSQKTTSTPSRETST